ASILVGTNGAVRNSLIVSNGGMVQMTGLSIGSGFGTSPVGQATNNFAYISNVTAAAALNIGNISVGNAGGVGNSGILDNVMWNGNGGTLEVGSGRVSSSKSNALVLQGGSVFTNFNFVSVGYEQEGLNVTNLGNLLIVTGTNTVLANNGTIQVGAAVKNV